MKTYHTGLVGDIGGTYARFAMVDEQGHIRFPKTYEGRKYASPTELIAEYLETTVGRKRPPRVVLAVAGPVVDGEIEFTNLDWRISEGELVGTFEFEAARLLNDFAAQALAAPVLEPDDLRQIGPRVRGAPNCPIAVLGPGTGFGVAGLARSDQGDIPLAAEGGHAAFAPYDDLEIEIWRRLKARYGRVSVERMLSGKGLFDLYISLCRIESRPADLPDQRAVIAAAQAGDAQAAEAVDRFCAILGGVAGDLALLFGARGGVYVGGGIGPRILERLLASDFRKRFEDKGRMTEYLSEIPTYLVIHPYAALVGAARALRQMERPGI